MDCGEFIVVDIQLLEAGEAREGSEVSQLVLPHSEDLHTLQSAHHLRNGFQTSVGQIDLLWCVHESMSTVYVCLRVCA